MKLTEHKYLDIESTCHGLIDTIINVSFEWTTNCDHAGVYFTFQIFKFKFEASIYDNRHWNYTANRHYLPFEELIGSWLDGDISRENFVKYYGFDPANWSEQNCQQLYLDHRNNSIYGR